MVIDFIDIVITIKTVQSIDEMNHVKWHECGMIGHGGLLRVFPPTRPTRGSRYVYEIYLQTYPDSEGFGFRYAIILMLKHCGLLHSSAILVSDSSQRNNS